MQDTDNFSLVVHVGMGKTGSSSIQKTLSIAMPELLEQKVLYAGLNFEFSGFKKFTWQKAGGWPELYSKEQGSFAKELKEVLLNTIRDSRTKGINKVVWSNESLFVEYHRIAEILKQVKAEENINIKIIIYIRRHDLWAKSAYVQWGIKHKTYLGPLQPFKEWITQGRLSFAAHTQSWVNNFTDCNLVNFDKSSNIVRTFFERAGINDSAIQEQKDNESPSMAALAIWAMHNDTHTGQVLPYPLENIIKRAGFLQKEPRNVNLANFLPTQKDLATIRDMVREDREKVNQLLEANGQELLDDNPESIKVKTVDHWQIHSALLMLILSQQKQINDLQSRIEALEN